MTAEGFGYDPGRGELWFAGETAEAVWLELETRRRALAGGGRGARRARRRRRPRRRTPRSPIRRLVRLAELAERRNRGAAPRRDQARGAAARADRCRRHTAGSAAGSCAVSAPRKPRSGASSRPRREATSDIDVELARPRRRGGRGARRLADAGGEPAEGDDREELRGRVERLERRREALGRVNPFAREEYETREGAPRSSPRSGRTSRRPWTSSRSCATSSQTVERRFAETFEAVQRNFEEVAATLFPGGQEGCSSWRPTRATRIRIRGSRSTCARRASG